MKIKTSFLALAVCFATGAFCFAAAEPQMGTWKLNEAKSKIAHGMGKNTKVEYSAYGDVVTVTVDGLDAEGKPAHNKWVGRFDGKYYPLVGDPMADARSYKMVDDHTLMLSQLKGKKIVSSGKIVVAADGKSRTVTVNARNAKGKKVKNMTVYDKD